MLALICGKCPSTSLDIQKKSSDAHHAMWTKQDAGARARRRGSFVLPAFRKSRFYHLTISSDFSPKKARAVVTCSTQPAPVQTYEVSDGQIGHGQNGDVPFERTQNDNRRSCPSRAPSHQQGVGPSIAPGHQPNVAGSSTTQPSLKVKPGNWASPGGALHKKVANAFLDALPRSDKQCEEIAFTKILCGSGQA